MDEVGEDLAGGCLAALFDVLPWQVDLVILIVVLVVWLVAGHPGW